MSSAWNVSLCQGVGWDDVRTVLDVRRLLEGCHLDERKAVLGEVLVRHAYSRLETLPGVCKLLALMITQT